MLLEMQGIIEGPRILMFIYSEWKQKKEKTNGAIAPLAKWVC